MFTRLPAVSLLSWGKYGQAPALKPAQAGITTAHVQAHILHPWGSGCKKRHPVKMFYTRTPTSMITVNDGWYVSMWKHHHWNTNSRQSTHLWSFSTTVYFVVAAPINSPTDKPQAYNELTHCIQQQVTAGSWQHGPSTSDTRLGESSSAQQKTASNGMLKTFLSSFSAAIRIKS